MKTTKKILGLVLTIAVLVSATAFASENDFGAAGAATKESYTIEEMLTYAIQDEYLARAEYEKIMDAYGVQNPFTNIKKSEETHIALLKPLFETYHIDFPQDYASQHVVLPVSLNEAFQIGVKAEIDNIAMYEKFLQQDLPADIKAVFERLKAASGNHLKAFERGVDRGTASRQSNTVNRGFRRGRN